MKLEKWMIVNHILFENPKLEILDIEWPSVTYKDLGNKKICNMGKGIFVWLYKDQEGNIIEE